MVIGHRDPAQPGFPQTVALTVSSKQIADLMTSFVESGDPVTRGWVQSISLHKGYAAGYGPTWYGEPGFYEQPGFIFCITTLEDEKPTEHLIGACAFHAGFTKLAASPQYLYALTDLIHDVADASTADIIMQFVVFGKEVFA